MCPLVWACVVVWLFVCPCACSSVCVVVHSFGGVCVIGCVRDCVSSRSGVRVVVCVCFVCVMVRSRVCAIASSDRYGACL